MNSLGKFVRGYFSAEMKPTPQRTSVGSKLTVITAPSFATITRAVFKTTGFGGFALNQNTGSSSAFGV
jgi:hypothetical protein